MHLLTPGPELFVSLIGFLTTLALVGAAIVRLLAPGKRRGFTTPMALGFILALGTWFGGLVGFALAALFLALLTGAAWVSLRLRHT